MKISSEASVPQVAFEYQRQGFAVIPVSRDKKPLIPWQEFQHRKPAPQEIAAWWKRWPKANVAIVTGAISGIIVLDVDGAE
ncbi:MAG: bifunctional DNA primase/polymerase, partial [Clostridia bacterium]|nr:bifunctional DNA primase/polymerase [Clostridia bacterium]